jgi:ubiquinone biosynthesis protein
MACGVVGDGDMKLSPSHLRRYKDIAFLLWNYGRGDLARHIQASSDELALPATAAESDSATKPGSEGKPEKLADELERLGPTFIKLGQVLAGRPDILPPEYQKALSRLQDKVAPFPYEEVEAIVFNELGVRISKAFSSFDPVPIAAASLGQVHQALLRDGRAVVVKVQRPGVRQVIAQDCEVLADIAELLDNHTETGRRYRFSELVTQFRQTLRDELNYEQEASNLTQVGNNLREFRHIHVPKTIPDYCSPLVLTMEHVTGSKVTSLSPLTRMELDGEKLADELLNAYLKQVLVDGVFHADPHPGNIFINDRHEIALLDLGMVGHVSSGLREHLLKLLLAVSDGHGEEAAAVISELSEHSAVYDAEALKRSVSGLIARHHDSSLNELNVGRSLLLLDHEARKHGLHPPTELSLLGKTLLQLDEVGRILEPSFNPNASIRRHVGEILTRRMKEDLSQGSIFGALLEMKTFVSGLPGRLNRVLENFGSPEFQVTIKSTESDRLIEAMQKIANRISAGIVLAALILGAALLMRVETSFRVLGYPGLAMICFAAAAGGGAWLVISTFLADRAGKRSKLR